MMMMIFIVSLQHVVIIHTTTILAVEIQVQNDNVDNPIFQQMMQYYKNKESVINWRRDFHRICINLDGLMINRILSLSGCDTMKQCGTPEASDRIIAKIVDAMGEDNSGVALLCISDNVFQSCFFVKHVLRKLYEVESVKGLVVFSPQYDSSNFHLNYDLEKAHDCNITLSDLKASFEHPKLYRWYTSQVVPWDEYVYFTSKKIINLPLGPNVKIAELLPKSVMNAPIGVKRNRTFYYSMNGASDNNINPRSVPLYYFRHNGFQNVENDYTPQYEKNLERFIQRYVLKLSQSFFVPSPWGVLIAFELSKLSWWELFQLLCGHPPSEK